jgi:peptidyl-prolyl cis-trans isomerase SurA
MVWSKAVKDSAGLAEFYNKTKEKYMWGDRLDVTLYTVPEKYYKKAQKIAKKALPANDAYQELNKLAKKDTSAIFVVEDVKLSRGDNEKIDNAGVEKGIVELENADGIVKFAYIKGKLGPMPKELNEIKGLMTADYQNYLEQEWIKELRAKYKIVVNKDVLNSIK